MSVDLTCPTCRGSMTKFNQRMGPFGAFVHRAPCPDCTDGRRRPELREWDVLEAELADAEADAQAWCNEAVRYRDALEEIRQSYGPTCVAHHIARTALEGLARELLSERTRRIRADE